jgi:hypothetical protein
MSKEGSANAVSQISNTEDDLNVYVITKLRFRLIFFLGLHPVASITTIFLGSVNRNCTFRMFLLLLLHTHYKFSSLGSNQYIYFTWRWPVGAETCSEYVIGIINNIRKVQLQLAEPKKIVIVRPSCFNISPVGRVVEYKPINKRDQSVDIDHSCFKLCYWVSHPLRPVTAASIKRKWRNIQNLSEREIPFPSPSLIYALAETCISPVSSQ